jgi:hypothetical protein
MARVFTAKAAKDYPNHGIKKGEMYYYWTPGFRGVKQMSKTPPKASQLTTSKMSAAYAAGEALEEAIDGASCVQDLVDALEEAASEIRSVAEEYEEASQAETGNGNRVPNADEMEEKAQGLNDWADSLENDQSEIEGLDASQYADMDIDITVLPEELVDEEEEQCGQCDGSGTVDDIDTPCETCSGTGVVDGGNCPDCNGSKLNKMDCGQCEGTGQVTKKVRKEVSDWDDLTEEEQQAMLEAACDIARNNVDCPL